MADSDDDNSKPSLDPLEGLGKRAAEVTDEAIAHQKEKIEEQKEGD